MRASEPTSAPHVADARIVPEPEPIEMNRTLRTGREGGRGPTLKRSDPPSSRRQAGDVRRTSAEGRGTQAPPTRLSPRRPYPTLAKHWGRAPLDSRPRGARDAITSAAGGPGVRDGRLAGFRTGPPAPSPAPAGPGPAARTVHPLRPSDRPGPVRRYGAGPPCPLSPAGAMGRALDRRIRPPVRRRDGGGHAETRAVLRCRARDGQGFILVNPRRPCRQRLLAILDGV